MTTRSRELVVCYGAARDRRNTRRWFRITWLGAFALAAHAARAQTGTLVGRVTNSLTGAPVVAAQVTVTGTTVATRVDSDGRFRLPNVPITAREARARGLGYQPATVTFSLTADATTTVTMAMTASTIELDAVMVTGAVGDTRRRAVGHSVSVVNGSEIVSRSAVSKLTEVLQAKVPGLTVTPTSGTVGTAASYRLRGAGSLGAANTPTIYVDGVRVSARTQGNYDVFGQSTTALDAISPADIESIEVIKGPSASTLYGAEAAAGVIQIFTKKGRSGRTRWNTRVEAGQSDWDERSRPMNFAVVTAARRDSVADYPGFQGKALGDLVSFRPMSDGRALRDANLSKLVVSAAGGAERYTFFVSAAKANEEGVYLNNYSNLTSGRANVTFVPTNTLSFSSNVALSHTHLRLPLSDNAGPYGIMSSSYLAVPGKLYRATSGEQNYSQVNPDQAAGYDNQTRADRYTIGASADYTPFPWLRNAVRVGLDANVGRADLYFPPTVSPAYVARVSLGLDNSKGLIALGRPLTHDVTVSYDGTATRHWSDRLVSTTSLGVQYLANSFRRTDAYGVDFGSAGLRSITSAAVRTSGDSLSEQKSVGFYGQQQLSFGDRLFLTVAARVDNNSAFGPTLHRVVYPKASISYVVSEEPYFKVPWVSALRLRAAWGQAGNSPGPFDATRSYVSSVVTTSTGTSSALRYASAGNPDLRPERGSEVELGFESAFVGGRASLDASYYRKITHDALIPVPVAASTGFVGDQLTNLGEISNTGIELLLKGTPVQRQWLTIDATVSLATNHNELVAFGYNRGPLIFGFNALSQRHQEGFPLGGFWAQVPRYNADGTLVTVDGRPVPDTASVYVGPSVPAREMSLSAGVLLFGRVRVFGLADYKGGHHQFDVTDWRRDLAGVSWETVNPSADPDEVLVRQSGNLTALQIQKADFVKWRDLSISYELPVRVMHRVARGATVTLAGHNLKTWTRYRGADPESNYSGPSRFNRDDLWTAPQTRRYSAALALSF